MCNEAEFRIQRYLEFERGIGERVGFDVPDLGFDRWKGEIGFRAPKGYHLALVV